MRRSRLFTTSSMAAIAGVSLGFMNAATAQDADDEQVDDTIIVTATRRAESVQDVPINIAAVGAEQIETQGFDDQADFLAYVPGINVVDRGGRQGNPIIVRGLNADPIGSGDGNNDGGGTVATYVGEIPLFVDLKLNDLQRVEVLLGPQGTLYGAGTLGGAIRYIPNKPDFAGDLLSLRGEVYQYAEAEDISSDVGFTFNKSFGDRFAIRGSLDLLNDSGFIDYPFVVIEPGVSDPDPNFSDPADVAANLRRVEDVDSDETLSGRVAARFAPTDWLDATLTYYFQNQEIGGRQVSSRRSTVPAGEYEAGLRVLEPNEIENELLSLEVIADLGFAELTSATGLSKWADDGQRDQTNLLITLEYSYEQFPTFTAFTRELDEEERLNQEIRLVSTTDGPINWIVGAFYNKFESVGSSSEFTPGYAEFAGFDRPDNLEYFSQGTTELEEQAVFGEVGYTFADRLTLTVGGRYYDYELTTFDRVDFPLFDPDFVPRSLSEIESQLPGDPNASQGGQSDNGSLFKFNASFDVTDDLLTYVTVSEGYRIGNSNGVATCPEFDPTAEVQQGACALLPGQRFGPEPGDISQRDETQFGPDETTNYEFGVKSTLLDGALTLNGAVYLVEWTDPQLSSATVNANIPITINADGAESRGLEISGDWQATDRFRLRGSFSYVDSQLTAPVPSLVRSITPPGFGEFFIDGQDGDRLPGSPQTQYSAFASYDWPLANGRDLTFNFGYAYQGDVLTRTGGRGDSLTLESFGIANTSLVYDAGEWKLTLFADNVFNEYAETGAVGTPLFNQVLVDADGGPVNNRTFYTHITPPRAVGVRFTWDVFN